jgi:hypothetical protein
MWFSLAMLVQINAAAALAYVDVEVFFSQNVTFRLLSILFPLAVLVWVHLTPSLSTQAGELFRRCRGTDRPQWSFNPTEWHFALWVGLASVVILWLYCREVPISRSGLAAVLTRLEESAIAREESLKLLDKAWLRYAYLLHMSVLGPFLAAVIFVWRPREYTLRWLRLPLILLITGTTMFTGARSPAGVLLLGLAIIYLLKKGVRRGGLAIGASAFVALLVATVLSVFRQAELEVTSIDVYKEALARGIFRRTFVVPFEGGLWTNLYAEEYGLRGVHNIRPLAFKLGCDYESLPNLVGLEFAPRALESVSANTCFLFDLQASFGLPAGWAVALVLLCVLDAALYFFRDLSPGVLLVLMGMFLLCALSLISCSYTTCLISHGLLPVVVLAISFSWFFRKSTAFRLSQARLRQSRSGTLPLSYLKR